MKFDASGKLVETIEVPKLEFDDEALGDNTFKIEADEIEDEEDQEMKEESEPAP